MWNTRRKKRISAAAALGALTVLLATGCSFSIGDAEKKNKTTASEDAAAVEEGPAEETPTAVETPAAVETPVGDDPTEPENTGVSEEGAVHKARVALTISDKLTESTGKRPKLVTCPGHLPARVGATIRCQVTTADDAFGVIVTATSVNGKQVYYNLKVDDSAE